MPGHAHHLGLVEPHIAQIKELRRAQLPEPDLSVPHTHGQQARLHRVDSQAVHVAVQTGQVERQLAAGQVVNCQTAVLSHAVDQAVSAGAQAENASEVGAVEDIELVAALLAGTGEVPAQQLATRSARQYRGVVQPAAGYEALSRRPPRFGSGPQSERLQLPALRARPDPGKSLVFFKGLKFCL